jgi:2-polyprenyl-3-methyl-5-hydroxy-6-metoxy-1,4-benzoquinol methylase
MNRRFILTSTYERDARDIWQRKAALRERIVLAYNNPIIRWYSRIRFHIINVNFLETLEQHLSPAARVLDIGCGFGLFAMYYALNAPDRRITGFDLSEPRIQEATQVAAKLGLTNVRFSRQDATTYQFTQQFDAVITLDLLHHVGPEVAERLIEQSYQALTLGGILLVKDVNTSPLLKLWFTYALDKLMMPRSHVHYRSALAWKAVIQRAGFANVWWYPLNDYLPYPHVLLVAQK